MTVRVTLDTERLAQLLRDKPAEVARAVAATAFEVQGLAQVAAPVDTGALRASIEAVEKAPTTWWVQVGVEYARWVEFGTSRMAAQPYLTPAAERGRLRLADRLRGLFGP